MATAAVLLSEHTPDNSNNHNDLFDTAVTALYSDLHQSATSATARPLTVVRDMRMYMQRIGLSQEDVVHSTTRPPPYTRTSSTSSSSSSSSSSTRTTTRSLVHITGTKGKGSTACLTEVVLRQAYGLRTGLFTGPHLVDIRERIRINGNPVSKTVFGQVYWELRRRLEAFDDDQKRNTNSHPEPNGGHAEVDPAELPLLPGYFRMLSLMAFYIFAHYDPFIEVILLEVGIGGRYDATNVLDLQAGWRSYACGVTMLEYDHCAVLGNTLERIAWEKGGIFRCRKLSSPVSPRPPGLMDKKTGHVEDAATENHPYDTSHHQPPPPTAVDDSSSTRRPCLFFALDANPDSTLDVLRHCASIDGEGSMLQVLGGTRAGENGNNNNTLLFAEKMIPDHVPLGLPGEHQRMNAELAVALCKAVMNEEEPGRPGQTTTSDADIFRALGMASWPGRCQTVELATLPTTSATKYPNITLRLDGAHTVKSIMAGLQWYQSVVTSTTKPSSDPSNNSIPQKILIFNCSYDRNPIELLQLLLPAGFFRVYFCRADSGRPQAVPKKTANELLLEHYGNNLEGGGSLDTNGQSSNHDNDDDDNSTWQQTLALVWKYLEEESGMVKATTKACLSVGEALSDLSMGPETATRQEVLVIGSLYLVGSTLDVVEWSEPSAEGRIISES